MILEPLRLGIGSFACTWEVGVPGFPPPPHRFGVRELVDRSSELGLSLVQIGDNIPLTGVTADDLRALRWSADSAGVAIEVGTRGLTVANVERHLEVCDALGSSLLRVVPDSGAGEPDLGELSRVLDRVEPVLRGAGVTLAIENHDRLRAADLASLVEPYAAFESIGICLDTINSLGSFEGYREVVATLAPYTVNLHVKDAVIRRQPHNMGFVVEGTPAGEGAIDFAWIAQTLEPYGRCTTAILELWVPPVAAGGPSGEIDIRATIERERDWAWRSVRALDK